MDSQAHLERFFIALIPPLEVQTRITEIKQEFQERYGSAAALRSPPHITLYPPFEWARTALPLLAHTLSQIASNRAAFPLPLRGFGAFPSRVIYIQVQPTPDLTVLHSSLAEGMLRSHKLIYPARHPTFHPHLTVAFHDLRPAAFHQAWPEFQRRSFEALPTIEALTLLHHDGHVWQIEQQYPFQTPTPKGFC